MLLIQCPWCGERAESEFNYGGEAGIVRPVRADSKDKESWLDDAQWGDYVFMRKNTRGVFREQWVHTHGCRRWFEAERDTVTHQFIAFHKLGEACAPTPADTPATLPAGTATTKSTSTQASPAPADQRPAPEALPSGDAFVAQPAADGTAATSASSPSTTTPTADQPATPAGSSSQGAA